MSTEREILEEEKRLRRLRLIISLTTSVIGQGGVSIDEALKLIASAKRSALQLFPDKEHVFDLIYIPRFRRLLNEVYRRS